MYAKSRAQFGKSSFGQQFAVMEGNLLLATMAQHYRFELLPDHDFAVDVFISLRPKGGLPMRIMAR